MIDKVAVSFFYKEGGQGKWMKKHQMASDCQGHGKKFYVLVSIGPSLIHFQSFSPPSIFRKSVQRWHVNDMISELQGLTSNGRNNVR